MHRFDVFPDELSQPNSQIARRRVLGRLSMFSYKPGNPGHPWPVHTGKQLKSEWLRILRIRWDQLSPLKSFPPIPISSLPTPPPPLSHIYRPFSSLPLSSIPTQIPWCSGNVCVCTMLAPYHAIASAPVHLGKPANATVLCTSAVLIDFRQDFFPLRPSFLVRIAPH